MATAASPTAYRPAPHDSMLSTKRFNAPGRGAPTKVPTSPRGASPGPPTLNLDTLQRHRHLQYSGDPPESSTLGPASSGNLQQTAAVSGPSTPSLRGADGGIKPRQGKQHGKQGAQKKRSFSSILLAATATATSTADVASADTGPPEKKYQPGGSEDDSSRNKAEGSGLMMSAATSAAFLTPGRRSLSANGGSGGFAGSSTLMMQATTTTAPNKAQRKSLSAPIITAVGPEAKSVGTSAGQLHAPAPAKSGAAKKSTKGVGRARPSTLHLLTHDNGDHDDDDDDDDEEEEEEEEEDDSDQAGVEDAAKQEPSTPRADVSHFRGDRNGESNLLLKTPPMSAPQSGSAPWGCGGNATAAAAAAAKESKHQSQRPAQTKKTSNPEGGEATGSTAPLSALLPGGIPQELLSSLDPELMQQIASLSAHGNAAMMMTKGAAASSAAPAAAAASAVAADAAAAAGRRSPSCRPTKLPTALNMIQSLEDRRAGADIPELDLGPPALGNSQSASGLPSGAGSPGLLARNASISSSGAVSLSTPKTPRGASRPPLARSCGGSAAYSGSLPTMPMRSSGSVSEAGSEPEMSGCMTPRQTSEKSTGGGGSGAKKRPRFTEAQVVILEREFQVDQELTPERKAELAGLIKVRPRQVAVWFQNRKVRFKSDMREEEIGSLQDRYSNLMSKCTELQSDYELLKGDYSDLLLYNTRLMAKVKQLENVMNDEFSASLSPSCDEVQRDANGNPSGLAFVDLLPESAATAHSLIDLPHHASHDNAAEADDFQSAKSFLPMETCQLAGADDLGLPTCQGGAVSARAHLAASDPCDGFRQMASHEPRLGHGSGMEGEFGVQEESQENPTERTCLEFMQVAAAHSRLDGNEPEDLQESPKGFWNLLHSSDPREEAEDAGDGLMIGQFAPTGAALLTRSNSSSSSHSRSRMPYAEAHLQHELRAEAEDGKPGGKGRIMDGEDDFHTMISSMVREPEDPKLMTEALQFFMPVCFDDSATSAATGTEGHIDDAMAGHGDLDMNESVMWKDAEFEEVLHQDEARRELEFMSSLMDSNV